MTKIFISYRRDDSAPEALNIAQSLEREFGIGNVFHDIDLKSGQQFPEILRNHLDQCNVLLAIIGPDWTNALNELGVRRLNDEKDWVRLEISTALRRSIPVIPVLIEGASLPTRSELPHELHQLLNHQAARLSIDRYRHDISGLISDLRKLLPRRLLAAPKRFLKFLISFAFFIALVSFTLAATYPLLSEKIRKVLNPLLLGNVKTIFHSPTPVPNDPGELSLQTATPETLTIGLSIVSVRVNEDGHIDIKLKNSGNDSAFITGITFMFSDSFYSGCGTPSCMMMPVGGTLYDFGIGVRESDGRLEVVADDMKVLPVSQQVPPKGVDRILVALRLKNVGNAWGHQLTYSFKCRIELIYDGNKRLKSNEFRLTFR